MNVKPFLKWAGGKNQLITKIDKELPKYIDRYFEPFLGGGAVLFHIVQKYNPKYIFISDINFELINAFEVVKNNVDELIKYLDKYKVKHSEKFYYSIRGLESPVTRKLGITLNDSRLNSIESAARFVYLNKTCFNGLYRVNKANKFNVPIGNYKNPEIFTKQNLKYISKVLQNVDIKCFSYEKILNYVKRGDFVYLDPPYDQVNETSFTTYTEFDFTREDQTKLKEFYDILTKKGCRVLESNSSTTFIKEIYNKYELIEIDAKRLINCDGKKRGNVKEVLIKNY